MPPGRGDKGCQVRQPADADRFWSKRPVSVRQADLTASKNLGGIANTAQPGLSAITKRHRIKIT